jgi:hypothetical protein
MTRQHWLGPFAPQDDLRPPGDRPTPLGEPSSSTSPSDPQPRALFPRIFTPEIKFGGPPPPPPQQRYLTPAYPPHHFPPYPSQVLYYCPTCPAPYQPPCNHVRPQPDFQPRRDSGLVESPTQPIAIEHPPSKWEVTTGAAQNQEGRSFEIRDTQGFIDFLEHNLYKIQQLSIKAILKLWIKAVEPKKQSHHPYKSKNGSKKPGWWPDDVPHQEPDHGDKADRKKLFIHFIMMPETWPAEDFPPPETDDPVEKETSPYYKKPLKCRELRLQPSNWIPFLEEQIKTMDLRFENEDDQKVKARKGYLQEIWSAARLRMDWLDDGAGKSSGTLSMLRTCSPCGQMALTSSTMSLRRSQPGARGSAG